MNKIIDIYLFRHTSSDQGTEGILAVPQFCFSSFTLELPWRDNRSDISCIPAGEYPLVWHESKKHKACHVKDVPGRSGILIHSGNLAGDADKGFKTDSEGCILLGANRGILCGQRAVLHSRATVGVLNDILKNRLTNGWKASLVITWQETSCKRDQARKAYEAYVKAEGQSRYLFGASYMDWECVGEKEHKAWEKVVNNEKQI